MKFLNLIIFLVAKAEFLAEGGSGHNANLNLKRTLRSTTAGMTAELLIICDKEFSEYFNFDRQKIIDYWSYLLWDINMKFMSLTKVNISFRVVQLLIIKHETEQPFIEDAKVKNESQFLGFKALSSFSTWIYNNKQNLGKYDIAVLATKAGKPSSSSWMYAKSACKRSFWYGHDRSVAIIHFDNPWRRYCSLLEQALGTLMGAPWDSSTKEFRGCKGSGYVMDNDNVYNCGSKRFFFSKCSNTGITDYLQSYDANCFTSIDSQEEDVIATYSKVVHPPSLLEQCSILANSSKVTIIDDATKCVKTKCYKQKNGNRTFVHNFYPFDNSPCGNEKACFRGRCLQRGYQLRNIGSEKCLHSSNRFAQNDYPVLRNCIAAPTLLDQVMTFDNGPLGIYLATPYSTPDASDNSDKCLTIDVKEKYLQYIGCSSKPNKWLGWILIEISETRNEFLLMHLHTKMCAGEANNSYVKMEPICNKNDTRLRWKFHERYPVPENVIKPIDLVMPNGSLKSDDCLISTTSERQLSTPRDDSVEQTSNLPKFITNISSRTKHQSGRAQNMTFSQFNEPINDYTLLQIWVAVIVLVVFAIAVIIIFINIVQRFWKRFMSNSIPSDETHVVSYVSYTTTKSYDHDCYHADIQ